MTREKFWEWLNTYQGEYRIDNEDVGSVVISFWFEEGYEEVI
jgi:hypothetical protein